MSSLKSGFKVSIPLIFCPGGPFKGHLAVTTNKVFGTITVQRAEVITGDNCIVQWQGEHNPVIQNSLNKHHRLFKQKGLIVQNGCSLHIKWHIDHSLDFLPGSIRNVSLDILSLYALIHIYDLENVFKSDLRVLFDHEQINDFSFLVCAFKGGAIWHGSSDIYDRLYLPTGLSVIFFDVVDGHDLVHAEEENPSLLPSLLINLNRSNIDRSIKIGQSLSGINTSNLVDGMLLLNPLQHGSGYAALFINNNQSEAFIRSFIKPSLSYVSTTTSNESLKKH